MMQEVTNLTVYRDTWKRGTGESFLRDSTGEMSILGFLARQYNVTANQLTGKKSFLQLKDWVRRKLPVWLFEAETHKLSAVSKRLSLINDIETDPETRESSIVDILSKQGISVRFL